MNIHDIIDGQVERSSQGAVKATRPRKTIWETACEYESGKGGGMATIFDFLASLHVTSDEARADLTAAWAIYDGQMERAALSKAERGQP